MNKRAIKQKEKRRKKINKIRNKRRKRKIVFGLIAFAIISSGWFLYSSNFFNIRQIEVKGNRNLIDQQVIEKSGIKRNDSLITLPSKKIISRLKKLNWVKSVSVKRSWPDTVIIKLVERKPIAFIQTDKDMYLIDKDGFVIDEMTKMRLAIDLPKIDELPVKKIKLGTYIKNSTLKNTLKAYKGLYKELKKDIYSMTAKSVDELYFVAQGVEIVYGKAEQVKLKNKVIKTILKNKKEEISTLDVRVPDKPVTRVLGR